MNNKNITSVSLDDTTDIIDIIGSELSSLRGKNGCVAVYAKRDLTNDLFIELIQDGYGFSYADFDGLDDLVKDKVYLIIIDDECRVSIEPAISSDGVIIGHDASTVLVYIDDCPHKIAEFCEDNDCKVIYFDLDGSKDFDDVSVQKSKVQVKHNDSGDVVGFVYNDTDDNGNCCFYSCFSDTADIVKKYAKAYGIEL